MAAPVATLPWRGPGPGRPALPLPPDPMPLLGPGRRLRKRWRYVGVFGAELMLCAARVEVGPVGQTFWAVVDRSRGTIEERTRKLLPARRGEVWSERAEGGPWPIGCEGDRVLSRVEAAAARVTLEIGAGRWVEAVCPAGGGAYAWTRKRLAPVGYEVRLGDGRRFEGAARGIEDESAGYHPRHTEWSWSAGVGSAADGRALGWNLVSGINDPPQRSERAIWIDGEPSEPGPVRFEPDLSGLEVDGDRLDFEPEAERSASENLGLIRSRYRQPFGTFTGTIAGLELAAAYGVMEHHEALW